MKGWILSVQRKIEASPQQIFDVLADPAKHSLIDGSGMVRGADAGNPGRLGLGDTFGMQMHLGVRYGTFNRVVEFDENRRIAWKTGPEGRVGRVLAGRIWRYELQPEDGATLVTESWDITTDHQRVLLKLGDIWSGKTRRDMERSLERLDQLVTAGA